jgi:hypothetical protein
VSGQQDLRLRSGTISGEDTKAQAQIATIKAQLTDEPNHTIIREAAKTLRNVTEGVVGGLISTAAQPAICARNACSAVLGDLFLTKRACKSCLYPTERSL